MENGCNPEKDKSLRELKAVETTRGTKKKQLPPHVLSKLKSLKKLLKQHARSVCYPCH